MCCWVLAVVPATLLHCRQIELGSLRPGGVSLLQERMVSLFPYTNRPTFPVKKETDFPTYNGSHSKRRPPP